MKNTITLLLLLVASQFLTAQIVKDFYYVEPETKNLPVFVRGNLEANKILLYIQGGGAENGIDFGRSDYPKWKNTLETKVAIAYFDQRGLNRGVKKIDTSKINQGQVLMDIVAIAKSLKEKYKLEVHLFGHSMGGVQVLDCLATFSNETSFIASGIVFNAPITTDFSPERYNYYRPLYLKNLAKEFIEKDSSKVFWKEACRWMEEKDSIITIEDSKRWNAYVDKAYEPTERRIGLGMVLKVIFSRPYNPIKYLNNRDNKFVSDKLWYAEKKRWDTNKNADRWVLLSKIKLPILLLTGRYDPIAVPEEMIEANNRIENSTLVILRDAGHQSFLDQPDLFNGAVLDYLNR